METATAKKLRTSAKVRLNYTNLRRLSDADVRLAVREEAPPSVRLARLALGAKIPDEAEVSLEAYRGSTGEYERFDFGAASAFKANAEFGPSRQFRRVEDPAGLSYRVKVTDAKTGRLIAEIDRIKPETGELGDSKEFIKIRFRQLGGEVWRVSIEPQGAYIDIEKTLKDEGVYLHDDIGFQALAYPLALRAVAERLFEDGDMRQTEWGKKAVSFLTSLAPGLADLGKNPDRDQLDQHITQAVRTFANRHSILERAKRSFAREGSK